MRGDIEVEAEIYTHTRELDRHYIQSRYPNAFESGYPALYYDEEVANRNWVKNVERVLSELIREFYAEAVAVFGSWSRSGGDRSDIDLLIVSNSVSELSILDRFSLTSEFRKWRVDVFLYTLKELENMVNKGNPIAISALVGGVPLVMNREVEKLRGKPLVYIKEPGQYGLK